MEIGTKMVKLNWRFKVISGICAGLMFVGILGLMDYAIDRDFELFRYIFQGVFFGLSMGIGFPYLFEKLGSKFASNMGKNIFPELDEGDEIEVEGPANLFRGAEGVGGKIFLTQKKVVFKSHDMNIQTGQTDIEYKQIAKIIARKTMKLINNGMRIETIDEQKFDFVLNEREKWLEQLNERVKKADSETGTE